MLRRYLLRQASRLLTSPRLRAARHAWAGLKRRLGGAPPTLWLFHQADDPYAHLLLQALPALLEQYAVRLHVLLVPPPGDEAVPDRARLQAWARRDAAQLAQALGLEFSDPGAPPAAAQVVAANRILLQVFDLAVPWRDKLTAALTIGNALWADPTDPTLFDILADTDPAIDPALNAALAANAAERARRGHYLGAMIWFEGDWYWGVDRLACLDARLARMGLARDDGTSRIAPPRLPEIACTQAPVAGSRPQLEFYFSLRSPYSALAVARVLRLADHYGADLRLCYVLPMLMRGMPVPVAKRRYILRDATREAERLGVPFGHIADPLGAPTERGLAVLQRAIDRGRGGQFLASFMRGVWAEGIDAGTDAGLLHLAARAGLDAACVHAALADESWRAIAQANRQAMLDLGVWGVPSFRVDHRPVQWGQDRLCFIERDLIAACAAPTVAGAHGTRA